MPALFGSNSGGQSGWGARNTGLPVSPTGNVWVNDVFYDPSNPLIAYATSYQPSYLFKSVNADVDPAGSDIRGRAAAAIRSLSAGDRDDGRGWTHPLRHQHERKCF